MDASTLSAIFAMLLSLAGSYLPGFSGWFETLTVLGKRLVMLAGIVLIAVASVGLACSGYGTVLGVTVTCDQVGVLATVKALVAAIIANQAMYSLSKKV